jgi:hypothetical protein
MQNLTNKSRFKIDRTNLKQDYEDFIGTYTGFFPESYCNEVIQFFNFCEEFTPIVKKRHDDYVTDSNMFMTSFHQVGDLQLNRALQDYTDHFYEMLDFCIKQYMDRYRILQGLDGYAVFDMKFQKTRPGEGFHAFHYENARRQVVTRKLVGMLYLNDIEEGGETEFLYYPKRIKAQQGKLIIWPCEFTHAHRGNTPLKETKYAVTTWVEALNQS